MPSTWLARADMGLGVNAIHICTMHLVSMGSVPVTVIHICTMRVVGDQLPPPMAFNFPHKALNGFITPFRALKGPQGP